MNSSRDLELSRTVLLATILALTILNGLTLIQALPEASLVDGGCCSSVPLAKDFSAYYVGAWRLLHDPGQLYTRGAVEDGGPVILPAPESYKYMPSFLLFIVPLLSLGYQGALLAFDVAQFAMLPAIAALLWLLLRRERPLLIGAAMVFVLLEPSPLPGWSLSASYYWQWAEGQAKVFETLLLLLSFYLATSNRPKLSGVALALAAFDPRFALAGLPLFLLFNRKRLTASIAATLSLMALNAPLFFPPTGAGFLKMASSYGATTPLYYYSFIPLAALAVLYVAYRRELVAAVRGAARRSGAPLRHDTLGAGPSVVRRLS